MNTYWVSQDSAPPLYLVDAWELLVEKFGTEPFSKEVAVDIIQEAYPNLSKEGLGRLIDALAEGGYLGVSEREF